MEDFANALDNVRQITSSNNQPQYVNRIANTAKGGFVGLVGGLMVGWYFKKDLYVYSLIGTLLGGGLYLLLNEAEK
jgi:hypothetical protein